MDCPGCSEIHGLALALALALALTLALCRQSMDCSLKARMLCLDNSKIHTVSLAYMYISTYYVSGCNLCGIQWSCTMLQVEAVFGATHSWAQVPLVCKHL